MFPNIQQTYKFSRQKPNRSVTPALPWQFVCLAVSGRDSMLCSSPSIQCPLRHSSAPFRHSSAPSVIPVLLLSFQCPFCHSSAPSVIPVLDTGISHQDVWHLTV